MNARDKYRILIVDDHPAVRAGLASFINREPDLTVCGEAESVSRALTAVETAKPDLVTVDLTLRESNGLDLIKSLRAGQPKLPTLVISVHPESVHGVRCFRAGARGYLDKQEAPREIIKVIRRVLAGEWYFSRDLMEQLMTGGKDGQTMPDDPVARLSDRELRVFEGIGKGHTAKNRGRPELESENGGVVSATSGLETWFVKRHRFHAGSSAARKFHPVGTASLRACSVVLQPCGI